jgi:hypothetical protein
LGGGVSTLLLSELRSWQEGAGGWELAGSWELYTLRAPELAGGWAWRLYTLANLEARKLRSWREGAGGWEGWELASLHSCQLGGEEAPELAGGSWWLAELGAGGREPA